MERVEMQLIVSDDFQTTKRGLTEIARRVVPRRFLERRRHALPASGGGGLPARKSATVARVVIWSGFMRSSITAGLPLATARRNAGVNAAVSLTTSPCPPNAWMYFEKSGFVTCVPETRHGYARS